MFEQPTIGTLVTKSNTQGTLAFITNEPARAMSHVVVVLLNGEKVEVHPRQLKD